MEDKMLDLVLDVKVKVTVQLGSCQLPMREVLELAPGAVTQGNVKAEDRERLESTGDYLVDEGHSVLFSTHITADLDRIGDYVTLVHGGRIVRTGTKDALLEAYRIVRAGPDDLTGLIGVELIGVRQNAIGAQALVRTEEAGLIGGHVLIEAPTLEEITVHIGARAPRRNREMA